MPREHIIGMSHASGLHVLPGYELALAAWLIWAQMLFAAQ